MDKQGLFLYKIFNSCTNGIVLTQFSQRKCSIRFLNTVEGIEYMEIKFDDNTYLKHFEKIVDVIEDEEKIIVKTLKKEWLFYKLNEINLKEEVVQALKKANSKKDITQVSICTNCGKRANHKLKDKVEVIINNQKQEAKYMLCQCSNCFEEYIIEVVGQSE